jgi:hypothetical protein
MLRQENTELKHRLRQLESRQGVQSTATSHIEYQKLKRQHDQTLRELQDSTQLCEKLKHDHVREISKWKNMSNELVNNNTMQSTYSTNEKSYRKKIQLLTDQLDKERKEYKQKLQQQKYLYERQLSKLQREYYDNRHHATFATTPRSSSHTTTRPRSRSVSPSTVNNDTHKSSTMRSSKSSSSYGQRSRSPNMSSTAPHRSSSHTSQSRSRSPSSSLGGRFDPTAYHLQRQEAVIKAKMKSSFGNESRR